MAHIWYPKSPLDSQVRQRSGPDKEGGSKCYPYFTCLWNKTSILRPVGPDGLLCLMLCQDIHGESFSGTPQCSSKLETEHAGRNSGKTRKGFHLFRVLLPSTDAAVFISFTIMSSLHPMTGATDPSFADSAGCNGDRRELRWIVICFKALAREEFVQQAIVSIHYCSGIPVRYLVLRTPLTCQGPRKNY